MSQLAELRKRRLVTLILIFTAPLLCAAQHFPAISTGDESGLHRQIAFRRSVRLVISDPESSLDRRLLYDIYGIQGRLFTATMAAADYSAYPIIYGAVPAVWLSSLIAGDASDHRAATYMTISWGLSTGSSVVLKHLIKRLRPFEVEEGIDAKTKYVGARRIDRFSFPSGHAAITAAIATSLSLSYPHWYVIVPGYAVASSVSMSRIWLGVHYPSDVVSGFLIGVAAGSLAHWAGDRLFD